METASKRLATEEGLQAIADAIKNTETVQMAKAEIQKEGETQVANVQAAAQEITGRVEQIQQNTDDVAELKGDLGVIVNSGNATFSLGSLHDTTGIDTSATTRCRTDFIPITKNSNIKVNSKYSNGIGYDFKFYNIDKELVDTISNWSIWATPSTGELTYKAVCDGYVKILVRCRSDISITDEIIEKMNKSFVVAYNIPDRIQKEKNVLYDLITDDFDIEKQKVPFKFGTISSDTKTILSSSNRCVSNLIFVKKGDIIEFRNIDTVNLNIKLGWAISYYDECHNFIKEDSENWSPIFINSTIIKKVIVEYSGFVRILIRLQGNADFSEHQLSALQDVVCVLHRDTLYKKNMNGALVTFVGAYDTGDSTFIEFDDGKTLLIDTGHNDSSNETMRSNLMTAINDKTIDYLIISHYHLDHVQNFQYLVENEKIDSHTTIFLPMTPVVDLGTYEDETTKRMYDQVTSLIASTGCTVIYPNENDIRYISNAVIRFWNCDHSAYYNRATPYETSEYNDCSLCCDIEFGSTRMSFSGDILVNGMKKTATTRRKCNIYKANHHSVVGGDYNDYLEYWDRVIPDVVFTMDGLIRYESTIPNKQVQSYCNDNLIPNFVTGNNNGNNIVIRVCNSGWKMVTDSKKFRT